MKYLKKHTVQKIFLEIYDLIKIDDDPEDIAEDKDNHDAHKYHGNVLVTLLPVVRPLVGGGAPGDGLIEHAVDHREDEERDERHDDEIREEDVVTGVGRVISHCCRTYRYFHPVYPTCVVCRICEKHSWAHRDGFIVAFDAGVELVPSKLFSGQR